MSFSDKTLATLEFDKICEWNYNWWGIRNHESFEEVKCGLEHSLNTDRLPQTFVALLDDSEKSAVLAQVLSCADMPLFVRTLVMMDEKRAGIVSRLAHAMAKVSGEPEIFVNLYFERMQVVLQASMRGQVFSVQRIKQMAETMKYIQEGAL